MNNKKARYKAGFLLVVFRLAQLIFWRGAGGEVARPCHVHESESCRRCWRWETLRGLAGAVQSISLNPLTQNRSPSRKCGIKKHKFLIKLVLFSTPSILALQQFINIEIRVTYFNSKKINK